MYRQEKIKPYSPYLDKGRQVRQMFNHIASSYDTLNHRLSWNIDSRWRKKAMKALEPYHPQTILDVATGTGDLAVWAAEILKPQRITGIDFSDKMLEIAQKKVERKSLDNIISFNIDDCMCLTFDDNKYDAVISAFGIRNFPDLDKGLREMLRVMKPGGLLCMLELTTPRSAPARQLFYAYSHSFLPLYGQMISRNAQAYRYLTRTIEAFPQGEEMLGILTKAGFTEPIFKRLTFGICTLYMAKKIND